MALRTSSWWTKNSLRLDSRRTHPMRKKPGGGPDRIVALSHVKSLSASALLRRSAKRPHAPGRTSPGPARESRSRRIRCAARSRVVHGARRVGAWGPSSSSRSLSCARSTASKNSTISPECSQAGGGFRGSLEDGPHPFQIVARSQGCPWANWVNAFMRPVPCLAVVARSERIRYRPDLRHRPGCGPAGGAPVKHEQAWQRREAAHQG